MNTRTWLRDHLIAGGHLTETGLTRRARIRVCACSARVLVGLDDDVCALESAVDPEPLNQLGEALALLEGRYTLSLRRDGRGFVLDRRHRFEIAAKPAGTQPRTDVVREHRCGSRELADAETALTAFGEARPVRHFAAPPF